MIVPILLGSASDKEFAQKIVEELNSFGIPGEVIVASAHKVPEKVIAIIEKFNKEDEVVYVTVAGRSNGLSGVTAGSSYHPVIACPPFKDKSDYSVNIHSTLQMPSDTPVMTVLEPANVAVSIARIFGMTHPELRKKVVQRVSDVKGSF
jgi:5-(carboxyamino)imidazole ribonucleotide mutase